MANPEHLQILQQGVKAWNEWRKQHKDIRPDLSHADLRRADLRHANFSHVDTRADLRPPSLGRANLNGANLRQANLRQAHLNGADLLWANLSHANLRQADLRHANLNGANLSQAHLGEADLFQAHLRQADLRQTHLRRADLSQTCLNGADLSEARFFETIFGDTDLTAVQGLETCRHFGPSTLDHRTLAKSGPLPLTFLRGCGLPDALIDYLPSLFAEPVGFYCFISHASKDQVFAERLYADLQNNGVRCYLASEDLPIGAKIRVSIDESIRVCDKLLLILSKYSVASQWVEQEVETALARERQQDTTVLFPVRIDNAVMTLETGWPALIRNTRNIGDFRRWKTHSVYQKAFDRLLRDLKATGTQP